MLVLLLADAVPSQHDVPSNIFLASGYYSQFYGGSCDYDKEHNYTLDHCPNSFDQHCRPSGYTAVPDHQYHHFQVSSRHWHRDYIYHLVFSIYVFQYNHNISANYPHAILSNQLHRRAEGSCCVVAAMHAFTCPRGRAPSRDSASK